MKVEDAASPKDGDVSPINRSISNLIDEPKLSTSGSTPKKKAEPSQELRPNFSRVTPAQLSYISFSPTGRYQPVRPVSSTPKSPAASGAKAGGKQGSAEKYAGGGGIILLTDLTPDEEAEFIDLEPPPVPEPAAPAGVGATAPNGDAVGARTGDEGPHIALDENALEAEPPAPFEVGFCLPMINIVLTNNGFTVPLR
jgi:26S proteasome regulatory subunit N2